MSLDPQATQLYIRRLGRCVDVAAMALTVGSYVYLASANWALGYRWDRWKPDASLVFSLPLLQVILVLILAWRAAKVRRRQTVVPAILSVLLLVSGLWMHPRCYELGERQLRQEVPLEALAKACREVASSPITLDCSVILARYPAIRRLHPTTVLMTHAVDWEGVRAPGSVTIYFSRFLSYVFSYDEGRRAWVLKKGSSEGGGSELLYAEPVTTTQAVTTTSGG